MKRHIETENNNCKRFKKNINDDYELEKYIVLNEQFIYQLLNYYLIRYYSFQGL